MRSSVMFSVVGFHFVDSLVIDTVEGQSTLDFEAAFGVFGDGFESGDVSAWSSSAP